MKKIVSLITALIALTMLFIGCGGEEDDFIHEKFYGVVRWSEACRQLVVYIPTVGEVEIPEYERSYAGFDGYEENEDTAYPLKAGDLVVINFKYGKSWDENSVKIMKTFPGRFDRPASVIEALKENMFFDKTEAGYILSLGTNDRMVSEQIDTLSVDGKIYFVYHSSYNGRDRMELLAEGRVTEITEEKLTAMLTIHGDEEGFLEKLMSSTVETTWHE